MKEDEKGNVDVVGIQALFGLHGLLSGTDLSLMYSFQRYLARGTKYVWLNFPDIKTLNEGLWDILVEGIWNAQTVVMFLGDIYEQPHEDHIEILQLLNNYLPKGLKALVVTESGYKLFEESYTWFKRASLTDTGRPIHESDFDFFPGQPGWNKWETALNELLPELRRVRS